ncbi:hypothetical protein I7I50_05461 [Histoplasma capsulatum G186AR]|uniref:Uncharacterized protein n=1 Tax=Ajellomyces capsulatus TaxID=5037 RepID=A0A8H7Z6S5_AJECA|nr:hypothetical protein I7I52_03722 [Histoplasma capsulatum]QSS76115.1 hypothetical protein I7I50_05461 [Histoplasma capsulatum G186AR]
MRLPCLYTGTNGCTEVVGCFNFNTPDITEDDGSFLSLPSGSTISVPSLLLSRLPSPSPPLQLSFSVSLFEAVA